MPAILILVAAVVAAAWIICRIVDWFSELAARRVSPDEKLHQFTSPPDLGEFESTYGMGPHAALRHLYGNAALVALRDIEVPSHAKTEGGYCLQSFLPMTRATIEQSQLRLGESRFAFATDDFDNLFWVEVGDPAMDTLAVHFHDHDSNESEEVRPSLDAFLAEILVERTR